MSLSFEVLESSGLPMVRLVVTGMPAGMTWKVTGVADDFEWVAGEGTATGGELVFTDPWAPLGVGVAYTLWQTNVPLPGGGYGDLPFGEGPYGGVIFRDYLGQNVLTDLSGRVVVDFLWSKDGGDAREWSPRAEFLEVSGSFMPVGLYAPTAGAGSGSLTARTVMPHTRTLRDLVKANRPMVLLHNHGRRCQLEDCDVPLSRTVMFTSVSEVLSSRMDRAERTWSLSYRFVPRPHEFLAPVASWADVSAEWATNADLLASGLSNEALARGDWLVSP